MDERKTKNFVKETYSAIAQTESSCGCSCCGDTVDFLAIGKKIGYSENDLKNLPEAANMGLGCGNPVALASLKEGETVLDLGSGAGIDVFLAAKKVGSTGKAIGVDMTQAMVDRAKANAVDYGYKNVEFRLGEIEKMPVDDDSVDAIISNCVINLSTNKDQVFKEAYRVLKNGGRLMVSDLVTEGELPDEVRQSLDAWACCIGGALEKQKYLESIRKAGFKDVKIASEAIYDFDVAKELDGKIKSIHVEAYKK
ncbi:MAG: arsenite methyltransferase [Thermoproteota archaeon]|nr:arsenite methyltransferase [Thermoproteota archaeon]